MPFRRYAARLDIRATVPMFCSVIVPTIPSPTGGRCADEASVPDSHVGVPNTVADWASTDGWSSAPHRGCIVFANSVCAPTARRASTRPSSPWLRRSFACGSCNRIIVLGALSWVLRLVLYALVNEYSLACWAGGKDSENGT